MKSLNLTKPHLIVVVGIPGSGKTHFATQFSDMFGAPYLNYTDLEEITEDAGVQQKVWEFTLNKLIQTKQTMLLEGQGESKAERRLLATYARTHGYQPLYIWVQTEPLTAQLRATRGIGKQKAARLISEEEFQARSASFEPLVANEPYMVISGKHTYASQAKNVLKKLAAPRAEKAKTMTIDKRPEPSQTSTLPQPRRGRITIN